ncbi:MAG: DNA mismatch repair endonuclease MutL [Planctomycetota bacterium]
MSIRVLPKEVVDKIAAGEVIERPASVVKELIENALDAGAKTIAVEIEDGGSRLIKVVDDGAGFDAADLPLAFASHATSKLADVDDLLHIGSFGFRGEALASIGSVSRARIRSLRQGAATGAQIDCDGGRLSAAREVGAPAGTAIEVRDLFFNVPARRRFLRAKATELAHVVDTITRFSLSHPEVAFALRHEGKEVFSAPRATALAERIAHAHGAKFAQALIHAEAHGDELHLEAFLAPPDQARRRAPWQYLFVNGRAIRDRTLAGAMRRAYSEVLPEVLQPTYFVFLEMAPEQVDVNVHPTKAEVRFRDGSAVFRLVHHAVTEALQRADLAPRVAAAAMPDAWRPRPRDVVPFAAPGTGAGMPGWCASPRPATTRCRRRRAPPCCRSRAPLRQHRTRAHPACRRATCRSIARTSASR